MIRGSTNLMFEWRGEGGGGGREGGFQTQVSLVRENTMTFTEFWYSFKSFSE